MHSQEYELQGGLWFASFGDLSYCNTQNQYLMSEVVTLRDGVNCTPKLPSTPKEPHLFRLAHLLFKLSPRHEPARSIGSGMIKKTSFLLICPPSSASPCRKSSRRARYPSLESNESIPALLSTLAPCLGVVSIGRERPGQLLVG